MQLEHGYIDYATLNEGNGEAQVVCQSGYSAKPHSIITCRSDGTWSDMKCVIKGMFETDLNTISGPKSNPYPRARGSSGGWRLTVSS